MSSIQEKLNSDSGSKPPYQLTIQQLEKIYNSDANVGLSDNQVKENSALYGENTLGKETGVPYGKIFLRQVCNAMILVLFISMIIALAIQDWISGGVIAFVVGINIVVGYYQDVNAEKTMGSLRSLSSPAARVIRGGNDLTIPTKEVVPGDIVIVKVGDTVPADLRLIDSLNFETDEALLTGESLPISKDHTLVYTHEISVGDRLNMAFSSSTVSKGRATAIVVSTGLQTQIGMIAQSLNDNKSKVRQVEKDENGAAPKRAYFKAFFGTLKDIIGAFLGLNVGTPLHRRLSKLACGLFVIAVIFAIIVMGSQKMIVNKNVAIYAICVALSMIPSSLVVVLTITMAVGASVMVTRNVIVRKLDSLEALGAVSAICSDKTGTLTQGKMIVRNVWIPGVGTYAVSDIKKPLDPTTRSIKFSFGSPVEIAENEVNSEYSSTVPSPIPNKYASWLKTATLANVAVIFQDTSDPTVEPEWKAHGDPTEIAIQVYTSASNFPRESLTEGENKRYDHLAEYPFDSSIKRMSAVYKDLSTNEAHVFTKGAVERVLGCCKYWYGHSSGKTANLESIKEENIIELTEDDVRTIESQMEAFANDGLRVLAFATKLGDPKISDAEYAKIDRNQVENNLIFLGLVGIYDPPRLESAASVKKCHKCGVSVHMLTGDHPGTAKAIAQEIGILPHNLYHYAEDVVKIMVMTAAQFDALSDQEIDNLPVLPLVIARCAPQTKVRMIDALHRRGQFCAMTGDGVNDSPSLKKADVGIAMGISGSDVAKDASDIVLSDDNFASILNAVEEGRRMADNIQKFVLQLLAENVAQAIYLMVGLVFIDDDGFSVFPLSPVEVLWIIVVTSCFPAMGLGLELARPDSMEKPPKDPKEGIFTREVLCDMMVYGLWMAVCCMGCFVAIIYGKGGGQLGTQCNDSYNPSCNYVFRARSASFANMTWCALILAWEVIDTRKSLFKMNPESETPYTQVFKDLWRNQFLFWSVIFGVVTVFPLVYIPVINEKVFLHKPIDYEWGVAVGFSILFLGGSELYLWIKRIHYRRRPDEAHNPEYDLERNSPFEKYASFSRATTVVDGNMVQLIK
ncbi:potassium/sodium eff [Ascoidea rubescens DSM 1968]|uniref:P-type Na(+) transporter n=1 Tax=Ascoidea rubescens DSM 1968 TaxID=1344418 RepID=A0A1D2VKE8_9ASCO|nr:potassium/sodium eff [Ascoidea rubescens DSM 1968]ODV62079.1 potassium/sodium eff [Ascoidea rubescens DSM 1968]